MNPDAVVIGAGLAGLSCARELAHAGVSVTIREASDGVGGRVRTDRVKGFQLDRGFQVLLTAYPECRRALDYAALDLKPFYPGALVRFEGRFHRLADPWRSPLAALSALVSPVGSLSDKFRIARLRASLAQYTVDEIFARYEVTARERLAGAGFSAAIIDRFFRPLFGGIFLEPELRSSSRMFDFVFRMLADGDISIPAGGMAAIPEQLLAGLPAGSVALHSPVESLGGISAAAVVVATDGPTAARLLPEVAAPASRGVWVYYFAADRPPLEDKALMLNGDGIGPVNNCCVLTNVAPSYGPPGAALISAAVLETTRQHGEEAVRAQLQDWFGSQAARWQFLRRYFVAHAQPEHAPPALANPQRAVRIRRGLYVCGDHRENASLNGALASGRRAAAAVLEDLNS